MSGEWGAAGHGPGQTLVDPHHLGGAIVPFGGNDWLALTQEPTLEPELPICDPHHHFWDFRTARVPYQRTCSTSWPMTFNSGHNVRSTRVHRGARHVPARTAGGDAARWAKSSSSRVGRGERERPVRPRRAAAAIVGHANLNLGERVAPVLEALRAAAPTGSGASAIP
jgi:hypothetical protein